MSNNCIGTSLKNMVNSLGEVTISNDNGFSIDYNGCVYKENRYFATLIPDLFYDKATRFEVSFSHLKRPISATVVNRDRYGTGLTIFELPGDKCKSLTPLKIETEHEVNWGDDVYLPYECNGKIGAISLKVCPVDGLLVLNKANNTAAYFGSPIINSRGKLIGITSLDSELSDEEILELQYLWDPVQDRVQRRNHAQEISRRKSYLPSATAMDGVQCKYE